MLGGLDVVVTRFGERGQQTVEFLTRAGANVLWFPTTDVQVTPAQGLAARAIVASLNAYEWIIFTSANSVISLGGQGLNHSQRLELPRCAVVGPRTRDAALEHGFRVEIMAEPATGEELASELARIGEPQQGRLLYVRAKKVASNLAERLRGDGFVVDEAVVYQTDPVTAASQEIAKALAARCVLFASPSAAEAFVAITPGAPRSMTAVCIGATTRAKCEDLGFCDIRTADDTTDQAMIAVLQELATGDTDNGA